MGYAGREWRAFKRQMSPGKILMRLVFGHPRNHPSIRRAFKPTTVASISRDSRTGKTKSRGVRQGTDGWTASTKRKPAAAKGKRKRTTAEQRRTQRAAERLGRRNQRTPQRAAADGTNKNLKRDYSQGPGGRMTGSSRTKNGLPTPRQATGLTRLGCDWCRSSGTRPIYTGDGRIKTVIAVQPCNHRWSSRDGGPSQNPAGRTDQFLCPPCGNTGEVVVTATRRADGAKTVAKMPCHVCKGWIRHW